MLILRKLGFSVLLLGLALPVWSADRPGTISGYVRGGTGIPQMGAVVEVLGAAAQSLKVFTDENGFYSAAGLLPGIYNLKVSAPAFLPALREHVGLHAGGNAIVNVTLNTLFEAIQIAPVRNSVEDDDWKWVLRSSMATRPVLRVLPHVDISDPEVTEMVMRFRDKWRIERMAAGHCTGQFAFAELVRIFGEKFDHAGVGSVIALPS